jgi:Fe-S cluster assembly scaffold protein SufB
MEKPSPMLEFKGPADRTRRWTGLAQGLPNLKQEEWKYVPIDALLAHVYPQSDSLLPLNQRPCPENLPQEMRYLTVAEAVAEKIPGIHQALNHLQVAHLDGMATRFLPAIIAEATVLWIPASTVPHPDIALLPSIKQPNQTADALLVLVQGGAEINLILPNEAQSSGFSFIYVGLEDSAKVSLHRDLSGSDAAFVMSHLEVLLASSAQFKLAQYLQGGSAQRHAVQVHLCGPQSVASMASLQFAKPGDQLHSWVNMVHQSPHAESHQNIRQLALNSGMSSFTGKIHVALDAQKTQAYQHSAAMVLEEGGRTYHRPVLEIYADDVKCTHGATTGSLDEQALFYLQARGIPKPAAKRLLIDAFIEDCLQAFHPDLQAALRSEISISLQ